MGKIVAAIEGLNVPLAEAQKVLLDGYENRLPAKIIEPIADTLTNLNEYGGFAALYNYSVKELVYMHDRTAPEYASKEEALLLNDVQNTLMNQLREQGYSPQETSFPAPQSDVMSPLADPALAENPNKNDYNRRTDGVAVSPGAQFAHNMSTPGVSPAGPLTPAELEKAEREARANAGEASPQIEEEQVVRLEEPHEPISNSETV